MSRFCDRSPCTSLLNALGKFIFGSSEGFILIIPNQKQDEIEIDIEYCPFCGTRLDEVPPNQLDKFTRPRRRKVASAEERA